ncbi:MAG: hypothetical protein IBX64_00075 [Actinobacteria bacterium]|nr:hypothetical protein [Actinomycetota bacterium]
MAPLGRQKQSTRSRPPFDLKYIILHGIPFWIGAILAGWYFGGYLGLRSVIIGLILLGIYVGSSVVFAGLAERFREKSATNEVAIKKSVVKAVVIVVGGFLIRLTGLWLIVYILSLAIELNLPILAFTIVIGFTVILAISIRNWV